MANNDWKNNWQSVELSQEELEDVAWNRLANEVSGGNMPLEDAVALRKRIIASGYIQSYRNFLEKYREQHGEMPSQVELDKWHTENPASPVLSI